MKEIKIDRFSEKTIFIYQDDFEQIKQHSKFILTTDLYEELSFDSLEIMNFVRKYNDKLYDKLRIDIQGNIKTVGVKKIISIDGVFFHSDYYDSDNIESNKVNYDFLKKKIKTFDEDLYEELETESLRDETIQLLLNKLIKDVNESWAVEIKNYADNDEFMTILLGFYLFNPNILKILNRELRGDNIFNDKYIISTSESKRRGIIEENIGNATRNHMNVYGSTSNQIGYIIYIINDIFESIRYKTIEYMVEKVKNEIQLNSIKITENDVDRFIRNTHPILTRIKGYKTNILKTLVSDLRNNFKQITTDTLDS